MSSMSPTAVPTATTPLARAPLTSQGSLLPILVAQAVLSVEQANSLPPNQDNAALELLLRGNNLVTDEQLLKAYGALYQIPFVTLSQRHIEPSVMALIPEITARRYDLVAFERHGDTLSVALAAPRRLRAEQQQGILHQLQAQLQLKIVPAFATLADIRQTFIGYEAAKRPVASPANVAPSTVAKQSAYPFISLTKQQVPTKVLKLFPLSALKQYQIVAFGELAPKHYQLAAISPDSRTVQQVLVYLQRRNQIQISLYQTDEPSLEAVYQQYQMSPDNHGTAGADLPAELEEAKILLPPPVTATKSTAKPTAKPKTGPTVAEVTDEQLSRIVEPPISRTVAPPTANQASNVKGPLNLSHLAPKAIDENSLDQFLGNDVSTVSALVDIVKTNNVPKMVAGIVSLAISLRASDIHIEAEKEKIRLRYRVDGELEDVLLMPRVIHAPLVSRVKILSQMKIDENRVPQDGRFEVKVKNRDIDLRVSTLPTVYGEKVVIRILDKTTGILTLEAMGLDGVNFKRIIENIEKPYGIVLSTGPTGSGKSTTLYAVLQRISTTDVNVVTLEDPVEYEMKGINQVQIKPKIGFTFAEGLRSILRQDPNIIMVGEIRDKETAEMATHAALTGHLVLSTLHTNNAAGALPRLINMGIEPFLITSSINAVIGQRLVRRVCQTCKYEDKLPEGVLEELTAEIKDSNVEPQFKDPANWHFYKGKDDCPDCNHGYKGRIGIFEVMSMSDQIEALAVKKEPASVLEQTALKEGMITMKQDGVVKALKGLTTIEEVMKATTE